MKSEDDIWYSIDIETSTQNRYACKIDRVCVAEFNIKTGEIISEEDISFRGDIVGSIYKVRKAFLSSNNKVMHNAGFDLYILERMGFKVNGTVHDSMLMAKHYRNDYPSYSLKNLSWTFFGDTYQCLLDLREWLYKNKVPGEDDVDFDMTLPPEELVHKYCEVPQAKHD